MADKRKEPPLSEGGAVVKRQRQTTDSTNGASALTIGSTQQKGAIIQSVARTSALRAPIMELTGHAGEVFACRFDESGNHIASGSFDRTICMLFWKQTDLVLWNTYGDCENYGLMEGHKGAILDLQWGRGTSHMLYTASADGTLGTWDVETGERLRKHVGHEDIVNSVSVFRTGGETLASGSDDGSIGVRSSFLVELF
jgi:Prp8 binding protein